MWILFLYLYHPYLSISTSTSIFISISIILYLYLYMCISAFKSWVCAMNVETSQVKKVETYPIHVTYIYVYI